MVAALMSCGGNADQNQKPSDAVLPSSKTVNQNMMVANGENVVFFYPSAERLEELKATNPNIEAELQQFKANMEEAKHYLKGKNINFFESEETAIKLAVSEDQYNMVNVGGVAAGYGVAMARLDAKPLILQGMISAEEFHKQAASFYSRE